MSAPVQQYKKTRIAPTPSGFLHLGNVLSFAITAALAKKNNAKTVLRIDDLDRARVSKIYLQDIFDTLNFLEIPWDEGPRNVKEFEGSYSQLHRMDMYRQALDQLSDNGNVFACTCSRLQINNRPDTCLNLQLPLTTENASWRLHTRSHQLTVKDYNSQIVRAALPAEMHNFIVKKKDGFPAYQLTSVIDDLFYGIDLIVRGEDLWSSTLAQQELALTLGKNNFNNIAFYHHPLLMETSGSKLSKSAGATSIKYLRESGKKAADIYTLIGGILESKENISSWGELTTVAGIG